MQTFLVILMILAAIAALVSLVRGIVIFLQTTEKDLKGDGVSSSGLRQNKMMWRRIQFQAIAVMLAVLVMLLARPHA